MTETSKPITLENIPKGTEYEEYVAAYFQCAGYFIEKSIKHREVTELLELDIITYQYKNKNSPPSAKLIEVKSGGWGFPDVFKIRGWMDYIKEVDDAILICQKTKDHIDYTQRKAKELDVNIIINSDLSKTEVCLSDYMVSKSIINLDIDAWRYSYWIERMLIKKLNQKKKTANDCKRYETLENYHFGISSSLFFTPKLLDRLEQLYGAYKRNPNISSKVANEMKGNNFNDEVESVHQDIFEKTFHNCEFNDIQISTYVEHFARLSILKNLVDYLLYKKQGDKGKTDDSVNSLFATTKLDFIPQSAKNAMGEIENDEYLHLYPIFWQWFLFAFGGFILTDLKDQEYELFSTKTGIPVKHIDRAFEIYEILFPNSEGWFTELSNSNVKMIKMFPVTFKGLGADYRFSYYSDEDSKDKFKDLEKKLKNSYTYSDVSKWNNHTYNFLKNK